MATVTHTFVSAVADVAADSVAGKVLPSHWNAGHAVTVFVRDNSAPNNGFIPYYKLVPENALADANAGLALVPVGYGPLTANVPDGTAAGGNLRDQYATDLQRQREQATDVASGKYSVITGGYSNGVAGDFATCAGGQYNHCSGNFSVAVGGYDNLANALGAWCHGQLATARGIIGAWAWSSGNFNVNIWGDAQTARYQMRAQSTSVSAVILTTDQAAASTNNQVVLPNASSYSFQGRVIAREPTTGDSKGWTFVGVIRRGANAAATALVAAVTPTVVANDTNAAAWTLGVTADTTNGSIALTGTGQNSKTIQWVATVETTETTG